jgi:asparagine synthase (glutamine-hydrolysing)
VSVQFGLWNFDGRPVDAEYLGKVRAMFAAHSPDGVTACVKGGCALLHGALHVTQESRNERQPAISPAGRFLAWDGRLDNRTELLSWLDRCGPDPTDLSIVAAAWERQGARCLGGLVGDWSLSVLSHHERTLLLAKDFLGARPLFYLLTPQYVAWSTLLNPLVLVSGGRLTLSEEYLAGWLAGFPAAHLTPYNEIRSVPPASFVRITPGAASVESYWHFASQPVSQASSDAEYEERFRALFFDAVRRRLRSACPVIAELSGGMDSSSIVCVADKIVASENREPVETVSFFDDSEPNWNERPYFAAVEALRGRAGFHLNVARDGRFVPERDGGFPVTPAYGARQSEPHAQLAQFLGAGDFRVLLSGVGGDEFTGGVPTGIPELADLLRGGHLRRFLKRALSWAMAARQPVLYLIGRTLQTFLCGLGVSASRKQWPMPWLTSAFAHRHRRILTARVTGFRWSGPLPTFQENLLVLDGLQRQIACAGHSPTPACEKRYPFLDRDLLQFLFNVPRGQLVRPNQRRSLLRRSFRGIVPDLVLDRPRKAFVVTSHLKAIAADWQNVSSLTERMVLESLQILDSAILHKTLEQARRGEDVPLLPAMRALRAEWWLRDPGIQKLFEITTGVNAKTFPVDASDQDARPRDSEFSQLGNPNIERR